jgi:chemotaxis protein methyltransferase CheR
MPQVSTTSANNLPGSKSHSAAGSGTTPSWTPLEETLSDKDFEQFRTMIFDIAGISLASSKKALVAGRLSKRLKHCAVNCYGEYFHFIKQAANKDELQVAVDLLTTNETYFFREEKHFEYLRAELQAKQLRGRPYRVWSAASSSGEEAYSIAMLMADLLGNAPWEIVASDISSKVLEHGRAGLYPMSRAKGIPSEYLKRYCLRGVGDYDGKFLIEQSLRDRVEFKQINLNEALPEIGQFDAIFLRNVLIYFNQETKRQVINRMTPLLRPDGCFLIGHSETLHGVNETLKTVQPSIYRLS